ncbi:MAG: hypothetical protein FWE37_06360 [Spirochaetaceae bacterium]|nr:hypothetical protein [Spirochaetaceae bacterium]
MKIKALINRIIPPIPAEYQEQFSNLQLSNNILRVKILSFIWLAALILNPIVYILSDSPIDSSFHYSELIAIIIFNLALIIFSKKNKILHYFCYLFIASGYLLIEFSANFLGEANLIVYIYFYKFFFLCLVPDFRPKIFISLAFLYFVATFIALSLQDPVMVDIFPLQTQLSNIFLIILITKILLYRSKVRNFVSTFEINKMNKSLIAVQQELKNYGSIP